MFVLESIIQDIMALVFANPVLKIKNKRNLDLVMGFIFLAKFVPAAAVTQTRRLINTSVKRTVIINQKLDHSMKR